MMYAPRGFAHAILTRRARHRGDLFRQRALRAGRGARLALERPALRPRWPIAPQEVSAKDASWPDFDPDLSRRRDVEELRVRVLLTGASSFTGFWFASRLAAAGAQVDGARCAAGRRLMTACAPSGCGGSPRCAEIVADCPFGAERFVDLIRARVVRRPLPPRRRGARLPRRRFRRARRRRRQHPQHRARR